MKSKKRIMHRTVAVALYHLVKGDEFEASYLAEILNLSYKQSQTQIQKMIEKGILRPKKKKGSFGKGQVQTYIINRQKILEIYGWLFEDLPSTSPDKEEQPQPPITVEMFAKEVINGYLRGKSLEEREKILYEQIKSLESKNKELDKAFTISREENQESIKKNKDLEEKIKEKEEDIKRANKKISDLEIHLSEISRINPKDKGTQEQVNKIMTGMQKGKVTADWRVREYNKKGS